MLFDVFGQLVHRLHVDLHRSRFDLVDSLDVLGHRLRIHPIAVQEVSIEDEIRETEFEVLAFARDGTLIPPEFHHGLAEFSSRESMIVHLVRVVPEEVLVILEELNRLAGGSPGGVLPDV
ncbi:hypothetical protein [Halalkalicoccus salilacus]|uniref:hypothetical protein n=1 Tax=Halalkalicoccus salilacus TaxID=3117459 RepID=UPI00300F44F6